MWKKCLLTQAIIENQKDRLSTFDVAYATQGKLRIRDMINCSMLQLQNIWTYSQLVQKVL